MRHIIFTITFTLCIWGALKADVTNIVNWLLGINFTLALFSINFTFFGHQLSKYKALYHALSERQWFNIYILCLLPFIPLICYLTFPEYVGEAALITMPILMFSSLDNALLTSKYLSPSIYLDMHINSEEISKYLIRLTKEVEKELSEHETYLKNKNRFKIPTHAYGFEPTVVGCKNYDIWDSLTVIAKLSLENNDYPVFKRSVDSILKLLIAFYTTTYSDEDNYKLKGAIRSIGQQRFHAIVNYIANEDKEGVLLNSFLNELCQFLMTDDMQKVPCSELATTVASDIVWIGKSILKSGSFQSPIKALNTLHSTNELAIHRLENSNDKSGNNFLDKHNIVVYAHNIKTLGVTALKNGNSDFAYRCMESLSYLGCNAAKLKSTNTIEATLESLVQVGRTARKLEIDCFWRRCLISIEDHCEEYIGHIVTWLVQDIDEEGNFFMKDYVEQAYSRIRGVKCQVKPKSNLNPCFWIEEIIKNGKTVPHKEHESGMYGYEGVLDYSDFNNLKEYNLNGISPTGSYRILKTSPEPIKILGEEDRDSKSNN